MEFSSFLNYLEFEKRYSEHTRSAYHRDITQFLVYLEGVYGDSLNDWSKITHQHVRSWLVELMGDGISPRSIQRKISSLRTLFKFLKKQGKVTANPMTKIQAPKSGKRLPKALNKTQRQQLVEKLQLVENDFEAVRNSAIMHVLYFTGMRRAELIGMKIIDVDFGQKAIRAFGKGSKERLIPFAEALEKVLKNYLVLLRKTHEVTPASHIFLTGKGKKMYPRLVYNIVRGYLDSISSGNKRSPHVLRHTFATDLSESGADLNAIKELLGHSNLAATQIYTNSTMEKLRKVYEKAHPKGESPSG